MQFYQSIRGALKRQRMEVAVQISQDAMQVYIGFGAPLQL